MNWNRTEFDLGTLKPLTTITVFFEYNGNNKNTPTIYKSCGCLSATYKGKKLAVTLKTQKLKDNQESAIGKKIVTLRFDSEEEYKFVITYIVKK
jgi:hypothetical protein